jgi:hypothetical protein
MNTFYETLQNTHDEIFPTLNLSKRKQKDKLWINKEMKYLINKKKNFYKRYLKNKALKTEFLTFSKYVAKEIQKAKNIYYQKLLKNNFCNPKKYWELLKTMLGKKKKNTKLLNLTDANGVTIHHPKHIANIFNSFFTNIINDVDNYPPANTEYEIIHKPKNLITEIGHVSETNVLGCIKELNCNASKSPAETLPFKIFKKISSTLLPRLTNIINVNFSNNVFPNILKTAFITPIYKSGSHSSVSNYRPISVSSYLSKVFEKLIYNKLRDFIDGNNLLYKRQYGFIPCRNATQAIIDLITSIEKQKLNYAKSKKITCAIFLDFQKAFDLLSHDHLLYKLYKLGIRGNILNLLQNYLSERNCITKIGINLSDTMPLKAGVPQGSILGPLLFDLYINDMNLITENEMIHYADDTVIILHCKEEEITQTLNDIFSKLKEWLSTNFMFLNYSKTKLMLFNSKNLQNFSYYYNSIKIELVDHYKYLGYIIDDKLKHKEHILHLQNKISPYIAIFFNLSKRINYETKLLLYNSFILNNIFYAIEIYGGASKTCIKPLIKKIKRINKILFKKNFTYNDFMKLFYLRCTILSYKEINLYENTYFDSCKQFKDIHDHNTRNISNIYTPKTNTLKNILEMWNKLPKYLHKIEDMKTFKCSLQKYIFN